MQTALPVSSGGLLAPSAASNISSNVMVTDPSVNEQVENSQKAINDTGPNPFGTFVRLNDLKCYYRKTSRNYTIMFWFTILFFLGYAFWMIHESGELWGKVNMFGFGMPYGKCLEKAKVGQLPAQIPIQTGLSGILFTLFRNIFGLASKRAQFRRELDFSQQNYYPLEITRGFIRRVITLYGWRINLFWVGILLIGLGIVSCAYGHAAWGIEELVNGNVNGNEWFKKWFQTTKYHQWMALGGILGIGAGFLTILLSNPILRFKIKKILKIFGLNEYNVTPEIKEKVFRINKRDKMFCCVILCVVGLAIYIIFKRLIVSVFNKSLKLSKK